jgi:opacity protein-like surface antigen
MKKIIAFLSILTLVSATAFAADSGTFGKRYVGATYVSAEIDGISENTNGFGVEANFPIKENLDVNVGGSYSSFDSEILGIDFELSAFTPYASAIYYLPQNAMYTPYVSAGVSLISAKMKIMGISMSDTSVGLSVGAGVQLEVSDKILANLGVDITSVDGNSNPSFGASIGYWITEKALVELILGTGDDSTTYGVSGKFLF